jgi:hypothetical protein
MPRLRLACQCRCRCVSDGAARGGARCGRERVSVLCMFVCVREVALAGCYC